MADTLKGVNHDLTTSLGDSAVTAGGSEIITIIGLQVANTRFKCWNFGCVC